jgi:two-component system KDP operon response regulator KdpE
VEDDGDTRTSLGGIFSRMDWMVRLASTAAEGLEWINAGHEPCCLILDLGLPDGDGESVLRLARAKGLRTYVAVCTGSSDAERLRVVSSLGPDLILTKPVTATDIWKDVCRLSDLHGSTDDMPVME